jgi:hypothetical protein
MADNWNDKDYWNIGDYIGCYLLEKIEAVRDDLLNEVNKNSRCIHILNLKAKCGLMTDEVETYRQTKALPSYLALGECSCQAIQDYASSAAAEESVILDIDQSDFEFENSTADESKLTRKVKVFSCDKCKCRYSSESLLNNHLQSSLHLKEIG